MHRFQSTSVIPNEIQIMPPSSTQESTVLLFQLTVDIYSLISSIRLHCTSLKMSTQPLKVK